MKILHIVNPYETGNNNFQDITLQSLINAKSYASKKVSVDFLCMIHKDEKLELPVDFLRQKRLARYVTDINYFKNPRKLPILKDILDGIQVDMEADYIVYTNIDIGVMPQFYVEIAAIINQGVDAFIINRRRVSENFGSKERLEAIYSETGKLHNGYDCFVFKKSLYSQFELGKVCIGIPHVGNTLAFNLMCFAETFRLFTSKHLTFHIGYEILKEWGDREYLKYNRKEYLTTIKHLKHHLTLKNMPGASYPFFKRHFKWLMNPTIHYPTFASIDLKNWSSERYVQNTDNTNLTGFYEWLQKKVKLDN